MPTPSALHVPGAPDERKCIVEQRGDKWVLVSRDGKVLGEHDSKEKAQEQERAVEAQKHMSAETASMDKMFVFKEGVWNGDRYTVEDLDGMVEAFHATKDELKPYMKFGHGDDTLPAIGWVKNLYRVGKSLYADVVGIPQKIAEMVRAGGYARVSPEIFINLKVAGRRFRKALKAIGLLGGETPAVMDRENFINADSLYSLEESRRALASAEKTSKYEFDHTKGSNDDKEDRMTVDELQKQVGSLENQVAELTKKLSESQAQVKELSEKEKSASVEAKAANEAKADLEAKFAAATAEIAKERESRRDGEINSRLDKLVSDKKIVPAQREALYHILKSAGVTKVKKFKLGDKEYESQEELIYAFVGSGPEVGLPTQERSEQGEAQRAKSLADKAKEYAAKNKTSFKDALIAVAREQERAQ